MLSDTIAGRQTHFMIFRLRTCVIINLRPVTIASSMYVFLLLLLKVLRSFGLNIIQHIILDSDG